MFYYAQLNENGEVYTVCQLATQNSSDRLVSINSLDADLIGKHYSPERGFYRIKVVVSGPNSISVGVPATFHAKYEDDQDNLLPDENRSIRVRVGENEMVVEPVSGVAEFDVVVDYVPEGGTVTIEAVGDGFGCDRGILEVTVDE